MEEVLGSVQSAREAMTGIGDERIRDRIGEVIGNLKDEVTSWRRPALKLVNPQNWRLDLLLKEGELRKPRASLSVQLTRRDNLALDWYPVQVTGRTGKLTTEFMRWSDHWPLGSPDLPFNRLVMIRQFGRLPPAREIHCRMKGDREAYARALEMLIEGTCDLLNDVRRFTSALCDIRIDDWLYPNTDDEGAYRPWRITPAADEEARVAERKRVAWRRTHIQERFGVTAEDLIRVYRQAGGRAGEAVARLGPIATEVTMTPRDLVLLIRRLYSEHADLWDRFCPDLVPEGCDPRPTAKVIPIRPEA